MLIPPKQSPILKPEYLILNILPVIDFACEVGMLASTLTGSFGETLRAVRT